MECSGCTASRQALFANFDAEKVPQLSVYIRTPLACVGVTVPRHLKVTGYRRVGVAYVKTFKL